MVQNDEPAVDGAVLGAVLGAPPTTPMLGTSSLGDGSRPPEPGAPEGAPNRRRGPYFGPHRIRTYARIGAVLTAHLGIHF